MYIFFFHNNPNILNGPLWRLSVFACELRYFVNGGPWSAVYDPTDVLPYSLERVCYFISLRVRCTTLNFRHKSRRGTCIMKSKDRRDVFILITKHNDENITAKKSFRTVEKPKANIDSNSGNSVQFSINFPVIILRLKNKTVKWYRKMATEIILGVALVSGHILYKEVKNTRNSTVQI